MVQIWPNIYVLSYFICLRKGRLVLDTSTTKARLQTKMRQHHSDERPIKWQVTQHVFTHSFVISIFIPSQSGRKKQLVMWFNGTFKYAVTKPISFLFRAPKPCNAPRFPWFIKIVLGTFVFAIWKVKIGTFYVIVCLIAKEKLPEQFSWSIWKFGSVALLY
jgi:hypothetical protein